MFGERKKRKYDYDFFDPEVQGLGKKGTGFGRGAVPTTKAGIDKRINEFYKKNKDYIDSKVNATLDKFAEKEIHYNDAPETPLESFKNDVQTRIDMGYDVNSAIKMTMNSTDYAGLDAISINNMLKGMKKDINSIFAFKKEIGYQEKIEITKFEVGEETDTWLYTTADGRIIQIALTYIEGEQGATYSITTLD